MVNQAKYLKTDFAEQSRVADTRQYEHEMLRETEMQKRVEEERRRMELESAQREQALEQRMQGRLN